MDADEAAYRDFFDEYARTGKTPPLHDRIGLKLVQLTPTTVMTMELSDDVRGPVPGTVHGGILATFADIASAVSLWRSFDRSVQIPATTDMHMRYFQQPQGGPLRAEAVVVRAGKRLLSTECSIEDVLGRLLARSTATYILAPFGPTPAT